MTEQIFGSVAPIFEVDGQTRGELARDLLRLEIEEGIEGLRTLVLWLNAQGPQAGEEQEQLLYVDGAIVDFGKELKVSIGASDAARTVFQGSISGLEASFAEAEVPVVVVFAEDALMKLRMTHRMKSYEQMSDGDVARAIAGEHGLSADVDADGPTYDVLQQWNLSDLAFLRERAAQIQAEVWAEQGKLCFKSRGSRGGSSLTLARGNELIAAQIRADLAHQRSTIHVSGYDASARDHIDEQAGDDAVQAEATGGKTGPAVLSQALGDRVSHIVRDVPLQSGEARDWAKAEMLRRARGFVTVTGTTNGSPDMVVGSTLTLANVGAPFEGGGYRVTHLRHTYDLEDGHRTHFEAERPTIGGSL